MLLGKSLRIFWTLFCSYFGKCLLEIFSGNFIPIFWNAALCLSFYPPGTGWEKILNKFFKTKISLNYFLLSSYCIHFPDIKCIVKTQPFPFYTKVASQGTSGCPALPHTALPWRRTLPCPALPHTPLPCPAPQGHWGHTEWQDTSIFCLQFSINSCSCRVQLLLPVLQLSPRGEVLYLAS